MKGMSVDECVEAAHELIAKKGKCLLLFDVKNSRNASTELMKRVKFMMEDLNQRFDRYFPEHTLAAYKRKEKGFMIQLGDGSWAAINSEKIIPEIVNYQKAKYPDIELYWGVAENGYDPRVSLVK